MSAPATSSKSNPENAEVEVDLVGRFAVAWPRRTCAVCRRPVLQRHGAALLQKDGQPMCLRCSILAQALGTLGAARRVIEAR